MKEMKKSRIFICAALLLALLLPAVMAHAEGDWKFIELEFVKGANGTADQWSENENKREMFVFSSYLHLIDENSELMTETLSDSLKNDNIYYIRKDEIIGLMAFGNKAYTALLYSTDDTNAIYCLFDVPDAADAAFVEFCMESFKNSGSINEYYKVNAETVNIMLKAVNAL